MDFVTTRTKQTRAVHATTSRRVYLDTYAKQRTAAKTVVAANHPERQKLAQPAMDVAVSSTSAQPKKQLSASTVRAISKRAITLTRAHETALLQPRQTAVARVTNQFPHKPAEKANPSKLEANLQALYQPSLTEQLQKSNSKSANHVRTIMASALACGVLSLSIFAFVTRADTQPVVAQPVGSPVIEIEAPNQQAQPKGKQAPLVNDFVARKPTDPVRMVISSINVNAQVDGLGITYSGQIAVPKAYGLVGWYNKGKTVGEAGPAVFVGHYASGGGAVFDKLGDAKNDDLITVTTGAGKSYTYKITKKTEYPKDKVPMKEIFKSGDESRLEIITCQGVWSGANYNSRLVVTAELVK